MCVSFAYLAWDLCRSFSPVGVNNGTATRCPPCRQAEGGQRVPRPSPAAAPR